MPLAACRVRLHGPEHRYPIDVSRVGNAGFCSLRKNKPSIGLMSGPQDHKVFRPALFWIGDNQPKGAQRIFWTGLIGVKAGTRISSSRFRLTSSIAPS